mgnify:CR=1 FL=1
MSGNSSRTAYSTKGFKCSSSRMYLHKERGRELSYMQEHEERERASMHDRSIPAFTNTPRHHRQILGGTRIIGFLDKEDVGGLLIPFHWDLCWGSKKIPLHLRRPHSPSMAQQSLSTTMPQQQIAHTRFRDKISLLISCCTTGMSQKSCSDSTMCTHFKMRSFDLLPEAPAIPPNHTIKCIHPHAFRTHGHMVTYSHTHTNACDITWTHTHAPKHAQNEHTEALAERQQG